MLGDVDLDVSKQDVALSLLELPRARLDQEGMVPHPSGVHVQTVPIDPITGISTIDHKTANKIGLNKVDVLQSRVLAQATIDQRNRFMDMIHDPDTDFSYISDPRLYHKDHGIIHLSKHKDVVDQYPPSTIEDIAIVLALIRPAKKHLVGKPYEDIKKEIWLRNEPLSVKQYSFKKSHAFGYALLVAFHGMIILESL